MQHMAKVVANVVNLPGCILLQFRRQDILNSKRAAVRLIAMRTEPIVNGTHRTRNKPFAMPIDQSGGENYGCHLVRPALNYVAN